MPRIANARADPRAGALLIVALATFSAGCGGDNDAAAVPDSGKSFVVETAVAATKDLDVTIDAVGTAYPSGLVDIRPQVSGTLVDAPFVEGQVAKAGQLLVQIDDSKARASLALAEAQLDSAKARLSVASERLGRAKRLAAEELVSREEFSTLESEQKAADASVREHEAEVRLAERNLEDYSIEAPFDGHMGIRRVDVGSYVEAGTVIATLVADDPLEVLFNVSAVALGGLSVGQEAEIHDTDQSRSLIAHGRVRVIDPRVDTETRMGSVKVVVPNPERRIKAGQFVGITLVRERRKGAVVIPEDAVIAQGGKTWLYAVVGELASKREIVLGMRAPGIVEVTNGLAAGETIVTRGQHRLSEGDRVKLRPRESTEGHAEPQAAAPAGG